MPPAPSWILVTSFDNKPNWLLYRATQPPFHCSPSEIHHQLLHGNIYCEQGRKWPCLALQSHFAIGSRVSEGVDGGASSMQRLGSGEHRCLLPPQLFQPRTWVYASSRPNLVSVRRRMKRCRRCRYSMHVSSQDTNVLCLIARRRFRYLPGIRRPALVELSVGFRCWLPEWRHVIVMAK